MCLKTEYISIFVFLIHSSGHSKVHSVLVGTNQGSVLGYTIDMPSAKHRDTRSPIIMPIGECTVHLLNLTDHFKSGISYLRSGVDYNF